MINTFFIEKPKHHLRSSCFT